MHNSLPTTIVTLSLSLPVKDRGMQVIKRDLMSSNKGITLCLFDKIQSGI